MSREICFANMYTQTGARDVPVHKGEEEPQVKSNLSRFYILDKPPIPEDTPFSADAIKAWVRDGCLPAVRPSVDRMPICEITANGDFLGHGRGSLLGLVFHWQRERNCYTTQPEMWSALKEVE